MCLSKYVKVCFIGTINTTVSDVLSLVTRNYPTVCIIIQESSAIYLLQIFSLKSCKEDYSMNLISLWQNDSFSLEQ